MDDVTARLRLSRESEAVDRERYMAANLFGDVIREHNDRGISQTEMRRYAGQSIEAACIFWEEWDIAALTPDGSVQDEDVQITGLA